MKTSPKYDNDSIFSRELGQKRYELTSFNGSIREVRMYKRILSANEVLNNYNGGCFSNPSDTTGLVLWAPLKDGSGTSCADKSQYHGTGTITNPGTGYWGSSSSYCYQNTPVLCETHTKHFANNVVKYSEQSAYRYGFNVKEKDDETYGEGDTYDYGMRMYWSLGGRFMSVDPLFRKYSNLSPFISFANNPIIFIDPDVREIVIVGYVNGQKTQLKYIPYSCPPEGAEKFVRDTYDALNFSYNSTPMGQAKVGELANAELIVSVNQALDYGKTRFDPNNQNINWNNYQAGEYPGGVFMPPVTALGHELDHAWQMATLKHAAIEADKRIEESKAHGASDAEVRNLLYISDNKWDKFRDYNSEDKNGADLLKEENRATQGLERSLQISLGNNFRSQYASKIGYWFVPSIFSIDQSSRGQGNSLMKDEKAKITNEHNSDKIGPRNEDGSF